jgi:hypothetical protein
MKRFLPNNRELANRVWLEMNDQITNYIRGKVIHILVVSAANYVVFAFMGINYALLLGISVGCSVLIPYIGAVAVTIPVTVVALFQWGLSSDFAYLMGLQKAGNLQPWEGIVVENAPLGVRAGVAANIFTVAINSGPLPDTELSDKGSNLLYHQMTEFCDDFGSLIDAAKETGNISVQFNYQGI